MLIAVYYGGDLDIAKDRGAMYFVVLPSLGDEVQIDQKTYVIERVWHRPSKLFAGPKVAVLIGEPVGNVSVAREPALASA
jgi:hypothetical protein